MALGIALRTKTSSERQTLGFDYTNELPTGVTVSSATVAAIRDSDQSDESATMLQSTTASVTSNQVTATVLAAGTHGERYLVRFTVTLSNSDVWQDAFYLDIRDIKPLGSA